MGQTADEERTSEQHPKPHRREIRSKTWALASPTRKILPEDARLDAFARKGPWFGQGLHPPQHPLQAAVPDRQNEGRF